MRPCRGSQTAEDDEGVIDSGHPCIIELGLQADVFTIFFVLGTENVELFWFQRTVEC